MSTSLQFEWTTAENEAAWVALSMPPAAPPALPVQGYWRAPWLWTLAGLLLLTMGGGVYALEHTARAGWDQIEHELQDAVAADAWTAQASGAQSSATHLPTVQVVAVEVQGAQAVVQAEVTQTLPSGETVAYHTTDFYTESAAGWIRTPPSPAQLGPLQTLATEYLQFRYYAVDAQVVRAIAPRLDALYLQTCASFGLPPDRLAHSLTVELVMVPWPPMGLGLSHVRSSDAANGAAIRVTSPVLMHLPAAQPAAEWLYQAVAEPLVEAVLRQVVPKETHLGPDDVGWSPLLNGLRLWQVWQAGGALADRRTDVIEQVYGAKPSRFTFAVCQMPPLWQITALLTARLCDELAVQTLAIPRPRPPARLDLLATTREPWNTGRWGELVALETLVEYAVAQYGVEHLPVLLQALATHKSWATLIPAVYGVSAAAFEQGWQAYVVAQYGSAAP